MSNKHFHTIRLYKAAVMLTNAIDFKWWWATVLSCVPIGMEQ